MTDTVTGERPAAFSILLFGEIEIRVRGAVVTIPRRGQWVLALLALRGGRPIHPSALAEVIWADPGFANPRDSLRRSLTEVRRALGKPGAEGLKQAYQGPLSLDLEGAYVDLQEFDDLAMKEDEESLQRALPIYERGALLEQADTAIEAHAWIEPERKARQEVYARILERLARSAELREDAAARERYLRRLVEAELAYGSEGSSRQEKALRELMLLLERTADFPVISQAYLSYRTRLRELSAQPERATQTLYLRLRRQWEQDRRARSRAPRSHRADPPPHNLPRVLTPLVGREETLERVHERLGTAPLVTLVGMGGIGKTRLALGVAWEVVTSLAEYYPDGIFWVELAPLTDGSYIPQAIARALGIREQPGRSLIANLIYALREKRLLLVLDNCEHLAEECAAVLSALLRDCHHLQLLATSREPLRIEGECCLRVPPLAVPKPTEATLSESDVAALLEDGGAVRLFLDAALADPRDALLTPDRLACVSAICRRLEGIPLAIVMAAAQTAVLSPSQILASLEQRLQLLVNPRRCTEPRHHSLRAALEWSYRLLPGEIQRFFTRLAVFRGGWTLAAAEAVSAGMGEDGNPGEHSASRTLPSSAALGFLRRLCEVSLVYAEEAGTVARYRMLETVREYVWERLHERGEVERMCERHARFFLALAEEPAPPVESAQELTRLDQLEREHDNLRAALEWFLRSDPAAGLRLATSLERFWTVRAYWKEGRIWLERCLATGEEVPWDLRQRALWATSSLARWQSDFTRARELLEACLEIAHQRSDPAALAATFHRMGELARRQGDLDRARACFERSLEAYQHIGDRVGVAGKLESLGAVAEEQEELETAHTYYEAALALYRELQHRYHVAKCLCEVGRLAARLGHHARGQALLEESIALFRQDGKEPGMARVLFWLGEIAQDRGEYDRARTCYEEARTLFQALGDRRQYAMVLGSVGVLAYAQADYAGARALYSESLAILQEIGYEVGALRCLCRLAEAFRVEGDLAAARNCYTESVRRARELGIPEATARGLYGLGRLAAAQGNTAEARAMLEEGREIWQRLGRPRVVATIECALEDLAAAERDSSTAP